MSDVMGVQVVFMSCGVLGEERNDSESFSACVYCNILLRFVNLLGVSEIWKYFCTFNSGERVIK